MSGPAAEGVVFALGAKNADIELCFFPVLLPPAPLAEPGVDLPPAAGPLAPDERMGFAGWAPRFVMAKAPLLDAQAP